MAKIGLVLSGGMAKGAYQAGALAALCEYIEIKDISAVSTASIGTFNARAFCAGFAKNACRTWESVNFIGRRAFVGSVMKNPVISRIVSALAKQPLKTEAKIYSSMFNLSRFTPEYMRLDLLETPELESALKACVCLPGFSLPVNLSENFYYDGAMIDNIPIYPLAGLGLDYIICIYFDDCNYIFEDPRLDKKTLRISFMDDGFIKNSVFFEHEAINNMLRQGYIRAKRIFGDIFLHGTGDLEYILKRIYFYNKTLPKGIIRITPDIAMRNLNKVARLIARKPRGMD